MGIFEDILGRSRPDYQPADSAFPELTPSAEDAAKADAAAVKEAQMRERKRFALPDKMPNILNPAPSAFTPPATVPRGLLASPQDPALNSQSAGVQLEMNDAPAGTGVPFSTQAGMLPPLTTTPEPVPLPRPRPTPTDVGARGVDRGTPAAPIQIAPQVQQAAPQQAQQAQDPFGLPSILSSLRTTLGNNSNTLLALGAGLAGAPNIGQGISRAAAAAIPARAADISQQLQMSGQRNLQQALLDAGVPRQQAFAAVGNPKMAEALIQSYITDRGKGVKILENSDFLGNKTQIPYIEDKYAKDNASVLTPAFKDDQGNPAAAPGVNSSNPSGMSGIMAAARMEPNYDPTTQRDEAFLDAVRKADPLIASDVKGMAEGKMPSAGRNQQKLLPLVSRYESGFEANRYTARQNLEKSYYGGGEGAKQLRSANTVIDHGIDLKKAIDDLHNYSVLPGYLNKATGFLAENRGDKKYQDALARFKANANVYAKELETALTGKTTRGGTKEIEALFDAYAAPTTNQAALQQTLGMLEKRVGEHEQTYRSGMNKPGHTFDTDMLTNRPKLDALLSGDTGSGAKAAKPVVTFKPGGHYKMVDGVLVEK